MTPTEKAVARMKVLKPTDDEKAQAVTTTRFIPPTGTRAELVTEAEAMGVKVTDRMTKPQIIEAMRAASVGVVIEPTPPKAKRERAPEVPLPDAAKVLTDTLNAIDAAHTEQMALKAWQRDGEVGPRPATPHYDALTQPILPKRERKAKAEGAPRSKLTERGQQGVAEQKRLDGKRSNLTTSRKVTEAELDAYVRTVRDANPDADEVSERKYAVWIECLAVSPARWATAWARVEAGEPPLKPEPTKATKPAPAKKQPTKKAAPAKKVAAKPAAKEVQPNFKKAAAVNPRKAVRNGQKATRAAVSAAGKAAAKPKSAVAAYKAMQTCRVKKGRTFLTSHTGTFGPAAQAMKVTPKEAAAFVAMYGGEVVA